jgi:hypothetical protein
MNTLQEINMLVTTATICGYNMATIDIVDTHIIGDRSKYVDVGYDLACEHLESG